MKSYECTHWMPDCKSHLAFGHRNFSSCISQRDGSPESEATISQPPAQMTGGYITYQIIKCQYHIALLGTNIWKSEQISNIKYIQISSNIKYQILFITERDPGTGRNLHTDSQDLWTLRISVRGTHRDCYAPEMRWFLRCKKKQHQDTFFLHVFYMCFARVFDPKKGSDRPPDLRRSAATSGGDCPELGGQGTPTIYPKKKGYDSNNQLSIKIENL